MRRGLRRKLLLAGCCLLFAALATSAFAAAAIQSGKRTLTDIYIGAFWFFVISLIASSPLLVPRLKRKLER